MISNASGKWCGYFAAILLSSSGIIGAANYQIDFYGLFKDPSGKKFKLHANERTTKYLYGYRYIPANFDGILFGPSITANWGTSAVTRARVYNASINGGNISEEALIGDNVFAHGKIKLAIFCIHPYLTATHGRKSEQMDTREYWGALGSMSLLHSYIAYWRNHANGDKDIGDENGTESFGDGGEHAARFAALSDAEVRARAAAKPFVVNEAAFAAYANLVKAARAHGARVVAFVPPLYAPVYDGGRAAFDAYVARVGALFRPDEQIIDFNRPAFAAHLRDRATFPDGTHLSPAAAAYFSAALASAIAQGPDPREAAVEPAATR